jgi:hypothetical protein
LIDLPLKISQPIVIQIIVFVSSVEASRAGPVERFQHDPADRHLPVSISLP